MVSLLLLTGVDHVVINDLLPKATTAAMENVQRNNIPLDRYSYYLYVYFYLTTYDIIESL
jgi:tRNA G26 N,N-dimethylase Trm1